jgi:hypothetical protein
MFFILVIVNGQCTFEKIFELNKKLKRKGTDASKILISARNPDLINQHYLGKMGQFMLSI